MFTRDRFTARHVCCVAVSSPMRSVTCPSRRRWSRLAVMTVLAAGFTGCSADTSRFNSPNANPFASRSSAPAEATGSVQPAPTSQISSQPLPPPTASRPNTVASAGVSGGGHGLRSYTPSPPPSAPPPRAPAPAPPPPPPAPHAPAPPPARDVTGSITRHPPPATAPAGNVHVVAQGETLMSLSRRYHKPLKQIADANHIPPHTHLKIGDRIVIPGHVVVAAPAAQPAPQPAPPAVASPKGPTPRTAALAHAPAP